MKKNEEDIIKLQISKRKMEDELENVLMKNNILLKMNKDIKDENKKLNYDVESWRIKSKKLEAEKFEINCKLNEMEDNHDQQQKLEDLEENLFEKEDQIKDLGKQLEEVKSENIGMQNELNDKTDENEELTKQISDLEENERKTHFDVEEMKVELKLEANKVKLMEHEMFEVKDRERNLKEEMDEMRIMMEEMEKEMRQKDQALKNAEINILDLKDQIKSEPISTNYDTDKESDNDITESKRHSNHFSSKTNKLDNKSNTHKIDEAIEKTFEVVSRTKSPRDYTRSIIEHKSSLKISQVDDTLIESLDKINMAKNNFPRSKNDQVDTKNLKKNKPHYDESVYVDQSNITNINNNVDKSDVDLYPPIKTNAKRQYFKKSDKLDSSERNSYENNNNQYGENPSNLIQKYEKIKAELEKEVYNIEKIDIGDEKDYLPSEYGYSGYKNTGLDGTQQLSKASYYDRSEIENTDDRPSSLINNDRKTITRPSIKMEALTTSQLDGSPGNFEYNYDTEEGLDQLNEDDENEISSNKLLESQNAKFGNNYQRAAQDLNTNTTKFAPNFQNNSDILLENDNALFMDKQVSLQMPVQIDSIQMSKNNSNNLKLSQSQKHQNDEYNQSKLSSGTNNNTYANTTGINSRYVAFVDPESQNFNESKKIPVENQSHRYSEDKPIQSSGKYELNYGQDSCVTDFGKSYGANSIQVKNIKVNEDDDLRKNINETNSRITNDKKIRPNRGQVGMSRNTDNTLILQSNVNIEKSNHVSKKKNNNFINDMNYSDLKIGTSNMLDQDESNTNEIKNNSLNNQGAKPNTAFRIKKPSTAGGNQKTLDSKKNLAAMESKKNLSKLDNKKNSSQKPNFDKIENHSHVSRTTKKSYNKETDLDQSENPSQISKNSKKNLPAESDFNHNENPSLLSKNSNKDYHFNSHLNYSDENILFKEPGNEPVDEEEESICWDNKRSGLSTAYNNRNTRERQNDPETNFTKPQVKESYDEGKFEVQRFPKKNNSYQYAENDYGDKLKTVHEFQPLVSDNSEKYQSNDDQHEDMTSDPRYQPPRQYNQFENYGRNDVSSEKDQNDESSHTEENDDSSENIQNSNLSSDVIHTQGVIGNKEYFHLSRHIENPHVLNNNPHLETSNFNDFEENSGKQDPKNEMAFDLFNESAKQDKKMAFLEKMNKKRRDDEQRKSTKEIIKEAPGLDSYKQKIDKNKLTFGKEDGEDIISKKNDYYHERMSSNDMSEQRKYEPQFDSAKQIKNVKANSFKNPPVGNNIKKNSVERNTGKRVSTTLPRKSEKKTYGAKSNKKVIKNALSNVCFAGKTHLKQKDEICELIDSSYHENLIIVFKSLGRHDFKGLYAFNEEGQLIKFHGIGNLPETLSKEMVQEYYKYYTCNKEFKLIDGNKEISIAVDAVTLKQSYAKNNILRKL